MSRLFDLISTPTFHTILESAKRRAIMQDERILVSRMETRFKTMREDMYIEPAELHELSKVAGVAYNG